MAAPSASIPSPVIAETRTGRSSSARRSARLRRRARCSRVEPVDLVPDLDQRRLAGGLVVRIDAELPQDVLHVLQLRLGVFVRDVAHVQDHVGLDHLLQRGAECGDQHGRQIGNEADGIGQDDAGAVRQIDGAQRRVERREQHVGGQHASPASCD